MYMHFFARQAINYVGLRSATSRQRQYLDILRFDDVCVFIVVILTRATFLKLSVVAIFVRPLYIKWFLKGAGKNALIYMEVILDKEIYNVRC